MERDTALVIEDDPSMASLMSTLLRVEGFDVATMNNGEDGLKAAIEHPPDVILLDVMMPRMDGFDVCRHLRDHLKTRYICVIMVTAKANSADKVEGLRAGADDFISKPFDPEELIERVRGALRRRREMTSMNPLTHLPGNDEIKKVVEGKLLAREEFALMHVDLDNFKAFNDHYGVVRGDDAILALSQVIAAAVDRPDSSAPFVGHVGGDDMIIVAPIACAEELALEVVTRWDAEAPRLYDPDDVERGYIEGTSRGGAPRRFPLMTVSIGIATSERNASTYDQVADIASRMKALAKRSPESCVKFDQREGELRPEEQADPAEPPERNTVLIVDDNPMIREILTMYCEGRGFDVCEAVNGIEAYRTALERRPAFVVLDYRMPRLDGRYTAELLRDALPYTTVIALSAFLDSKPVWADAFIQKHRLSELPELLDSLSKGTEAEAPAPEPSPEALMRKKTHPLGQ